MIKGTPRFDAIAVGSLAADFTRPQLHLEATAGYVDSTTGETHGWTKGVGPVWSRDTMQKLAELKELMEKDLASKNFRDVASTSTTTNKPGLDLAGLGQHLNEAQQA